MKRTRRGTLALMAGASSVIAADTSGFSSAVSARVEGIWDRS
ncbi:hypothetical protein [Natrinema sp. 74]